MMCLKKGGTTAVRSSFMMPWTMRILMTCRKRQVFFDVGWQMPLASSLMNGGYETE